MQKLIIRACMFCLMFILFFSFPALTQSRPMDITPPASTNGAGFGSTDQLGASGSTPGFVINRSGASQGVSTRTSANSGYSAYSVQPLAANTDSDGLDWGWLGLLGLLGLAGLRSRSAH
ncbi:WGxxGxxG family protein [Paenibacillus phyllosphaerae]|uniref:WGxxGxxG family protein n=1 Tax=Paenibacillus phyllosphaerae TaxID=274593 RepID=UPI0031B6462F